MALPAIMDDEEGELAPAVGPELRDRQRQFVVEYVACGGNGAEAARRAGYTDVNAAAFRLVRLLHVQAALKVEQRRVLNGDLVSLALETVRGILSDPDAPKGVKATLALGVLDRGGLPAVRQADAPKDGKSLEEMSISELEAFIREKEAKLPEAPAAPEVAPRRPQTLDLTAEAPPTEGGT